MNLVKVIDSPFGHSKTAGKYLLGDNPATHESEMTAQLYKQHPYLGKYHVELEIQQQDAERGYAKGLFTVKPPEYRAQPVQQMTADPYGQSATRNAEEANATQQELAPLATARIPVIVKDKKLYSFDVFITRDGAFLPLSEARVSEYMFSANLYSLASPQGMQAAQQGDISAGMGGLDEQSRGLSVRGAGLLGNDSATKISSLVSMLAPSKADADAVLDEVANDDWLYAMSSVPLVSVALEKIAAFSLLDAPTAETFSPLVAVLARTASGVKISDGVREVAIGNEKLASLPLEVRQKLVEDNIVLVSPCSSIGSVKLANASMPLIKTSGLYRAINTQGDYVTVAAIAGPVGMDGRVIDTYTIMSPAGVATQSNPAGVRLGDATVDKLASVYGGPTAGHGVFVLPNNKLSEPVTIESTTRRGNDVEHTVTNSMGVRVKLARADVDRIVSVDGSSSLLPRTAEFVQLRPASSLRDNTALPDDSLSVKLAYVDSCGFSFAGKPAEKIVVSPSEYLGVPETLLALGLLGADDRSAKEKMAEAMAVGETSFSANPVDTSAAGKLKVASVDVQGIRCDMVKVAVALLAASAPDSVDAVLSLNFITPENVAKAMEVMPAYEQSIRGLAELLITVRLGLREVPEDAVTSALNGLERAVVGMEKLQLGQPQ